MSSAASIPALCVSTMGPCDRTFFNAWSTYAATSRVYSGGRSDRTGYSSPPIITLTACFLVVTQAPPAPPARLAPASPTRDLRPPMIPPGCFANAALTHRPGGIREGDEPRTVAMSAGCAGPELGENPSGGRTHWPPRERDHRRHGPGVHP